MMRLLTNWLLTAAAGSLACALIAPAPLLARGESTARPWADRALSPQARANALLAAMTQDEKLAIVHGLFPPNMKPRPSDVPLSAGYFPPNERLGIPALRETDASLGIAAAHAPFRDATALPSGLAQAASFDPAIAEAGGAMIGREARQSGFNILLAGGVNLTREPRNGRNFEYMGEDPLLAGTMAGHAIKGIQSQNIASTIKHFALNAQETGRMVLDARLDAVALRQSDLLAFEKAIEIGAPASVMCSYNKINGTYACENPAMLGILKGDWGYAGWVMSDWGAVHSTVGAANAGLDQESGEQLDREVFFGAPLTEAVARGAVSQTRLDDMVRRILYGLFATGVMDHPVSPGPIDLVGDGQVALRAAEAGIVLLKNDRDLLPLSASARRIAVIGSHADKGVLSGGGSSQVIPQGSFRFDPPKDAPSWGAGMIFHPSSPRAAMRALAPAARIAFAEGDDVASAVASARAADVAVVFVHQWTSEAMDAPLALSDGQDALVAAVAAANPRTIVVLENGGPVLMPWLDRVGAVVEAWYPGSRGGEAIANVLFGRVDPSGRLPMTFPASLDQVPNPALPGADVRRPEGDTPDNALPGFAVSYPEGVDVGYRWYARKGLKPLFPFGYGLSYSRYRYGNASADPRTMSVRFTVTNTGRRQGAETAQVYATPPGAAPRLVGWAKLRLAPGESRSATATIDPRLLASFDEGEKRWKIGAGTYRISVVRWQGGMGANLSLVLPASTWAADASHPITGRR